MGGGEVGVRGGVGWSQGWGWGWSQELSQGWSQE